MESKDLFLTPIFLIFIYVIAFILKKRIKDNNIRRYFIPALTVKMIGAVSVGLIYTFYYGYLGDTFMYFTLGSKFIWEAFKESPALGLKLLLEEGGKYYADTIKYTSNIYAYPDRAGYLIVRLSAFFGLFCYHTYSVIAIFFAILSFSGLWKMYKVFIYYYPHLHKELAIAVFFVPSVFFWGSGILKDSVSIGALGWIFYCIHTIFIKKEKIISSSALLILNFYVLATAKIYILLCFIPAAVVWLFIHYNNKIRSQTIKNILKPIFLTIALVCGLGGAYKVSEDSRLYSFDKIAKTAKITADWVSYSSKISQGSTYDLGDFDPTLPGMLMKAPAAIWVSLFRPYLWEVKNVVMLLSSLESLLLFLLTIVTIYKVGFLKVVSIIKSNALVLFCAFFSITFAFAVGISTYNFGTLVRYKIPLIPFFVAGMVIILKEGETKKSKKSKISIKERPVLDSSYFEN